MNNLLYNNQNNDFLINYFINENRKVYQILIKNLKICPIHFKNYI